MYPRPWLLDFPVTPEEVSKLDRTAVTGIIAAVGSSPKLKTNETDFACHLERAQASYELRFPGFMKGDHTEVEKLSKRLRKLNRSLANIGHGAFALLAAAAGNGENVCDLIRDTIRNLDRLENLLERCRTARAQYRPHHEPGLLNVQDVLGWIVTRAPQKASDPARILIGWILPAIYEHHFKKKFGLSKDRARTICGPGFRFINACLQEFAITQENGQPYKPDGIYSIIQAYRPKKPNL
jgi:hypothetical protein